MINNNDEEFGMITGYPNYSVSTNGYVMNNITDKILKTGKDTDGYPYVNLSKNGKRTNRRVHKLVALAFIPNPNNKPFVDHIDRNTTNNNVSNLRYATNTKNGQNQDKHKNNTSGYKGVSFNKPRNKYKAEIRIDGKNKHLGLFKTALEASLVYEEKAIELHGEFYYKN